MLSPHFGFGIAEDDGRVLCVDCEIDERHRLALHGDREVILRDDAVGEEIVLIITQQGAGGHEISWPAGIAWKGGTRPHLGRVPGFLTVVHLLKIGDGEWLGWTEGHYFRS